MSTKKWDFNSTAAKSIFNSNEKTKKIESSVFNSTIKEKSSLFIDFNQNLESLSNLFFNHLIELFESTLNHPNQIYEDDRNEKLENIFNIKHLLFEFLDGIDEVINVKKGNNPLTFMDISGLSYKIISKINNELKKIQLLKENNYIKENLLQQNFRDESSKLKNTNAIILYLMKMITNELNFPINFQETKQILSSFEKRIEKIKNTILIIKTITNEIYEIFQFNTNDSLIKLIKNYNIQDINQINEINHRSLVKDVETTSPLSIFHEYQFKLNIENLPFIRPEENKYYIMSAAEKYKKISIMKFSEISSKEKQRKLFPIDVKNYFKPNCQSKFLHFFKPFSKFLYVFDLENIQLNINLDSGNYIKIPLEINFSISYYHKSIISPDGEIYLTSGRLNEKILMNPDDSFYKFDQENCTLIEMPKMMVPRILHGLVYLKKCLYVIGGSTDSRKCTSECEKYDFFYNRWVKIANLNEPVTNTSVTSFGEK